MSNPDCCCACHGMPGPWATCNIEGGCGHLHQAPAPPQIRLDALGQCRLCRFPRRSGGTLCWRHQDAIANMLDPANDGDAQADAPASIPWMWARLDPRPGGGGDQSRRAPGFRSTPAASVHKLVMRDDRSINNPQIWYDPHPSGLGDDYTRPHLEDDAPPRAVRHAMVALADATAERWDLPERALSRSRWVAATLHADGRYSTEPTVHGACAFLHTHLDQLTELDDIDEIFEDLLDLSDQLRPVVGDRKLTPAGWCTEFIRDKGSREVRECGSPLYLPPPQRDPEDQTPEQAQHEVVVTCRRCHRPYKWLDLLRIQVLNEPTG